MMTLLEEAIRAEDISDALSGYRNPNPDYVQNIQAAIGGLAGLSWALREIDKLLEENGENLYLIEDDLKLVHDSISFTLADIWYIIGTIGDKPESPLTPDDFRRNWRRIIRYCREKKRQDLAVCLDTYKRFLIALCNTLQSVQPSVRDDFGALRHNLREISAPLPKRMLTQAEQIPNGGQGALAKTSTSLATKRSYERQRALSPKSPTESDSGSVPMDLPMPFAPDPPTSPANTFSTASQVSGSVDHESEHWAIQIFKETPSWTPLPSSNEKSEYHDVPGQPRYGHPGQSYDEVVAMGFPPDPPSLRVAFLCRRRDWRSRLIAQWKDHKGRSCTACLPFNMLEVYRIGPMLHFCRRLSDGKTNLAWLSLKFSTVERMILFACTFLSMRAHDGKKPLKPIDDWQFEGEECEFAGKIRDNGFSHALRIYRDKVSKAIRLQASVRGGQLDSTPVWTAFITHYITSRIWCQRLDRNSVCLRELRPHNFSSDYEFQRMPNGAFILNFETREDSKDFLGRIEDLGREYRRATKG